MIFIYVYSFGPWFHEDSLRFVQSDIVLSLDGHIVSIEPLGEGSCHHVVVITLEEGYWVVGWGERIDVYGKDRTVGLVAC